jgi:hypothetical protein
LHDELATVIKTFVLAQKQARSGTCSENLQKALSLDKKTLTHLAFRPGTSSA